MAWSTANIPDQSGRTAVVTGANGGLGLQTARALAEQIVSKSWQFLFDYSSTRGDPPRSGHPRCGVIKPVRLPRLRQC